MSEPLINRAQSFRMPHGLPDDRVLAVVAKRVGINVAESLAIWICMLDYASRNLDRWSLDGIDYEAMAIHLGIDHDKVQKAVRVLREKGKTGESRIALHERFAGKQSTERVRKHRQLLREQENRAVNVMESRSRGWVTPGQTPKHAAKAEPELSPAQKSMHLHRLRTQNHSILEGVR